MDIKLIKKLRETTGAGMLECKKALEASEGDYEIALVALNMNSEKLDGNIRVASKGLCSVVTHNNQAILFEVNAETDFVSKNEHFIKLINTLGTHLIQATVTNPLTALEVNIDSDTVSTKLLQTSALVKENIVLRRFYRVVKGIKQSFGTYIHQGGKVVTLVILGQKNQLIADGLAMQVAANSPLYLDAASIDNDTLNYEKFMYEKNTGSFNELEFNKHINEISLLSQSYVKNPEITVAELLNSNQLKVIDFFRFELGQGVENKLNCKLDIPCDGSQITVSPIY